MNDDGKGFGARLRACRLSARLSQEELADRSGLSVRAISNLEHGRTRWPYRDSLHRLADALELAGMPRAEFLAAAGRRLVRAANSGSAVASGITGPIGSAGAQAASKRVVPRFLPPGVPGFVGRTDQLAALSEVLNQPGGTAVIAAIGGTAGVGKTALAVHWAHRVAEEFPDGQVFVNLRGFDPLAAAMRPADAVRVLLDALEVRGDRLPQTEEAQFGLYRSLLAGKRMLVVLDNARDAAQVRPLLPGAPTCRVVVTSRNELTGLAAIEAARPLMLDVLTEAEARELLRERLGESRLAAEPSAAARIIRSCARLPLALCVIAARAAMRPDFPLAGLATDLAASPGLDAFAVGGDPGADVRAAFSWSCRQLDSGQARVFRLAGLHPGPDFDRYAMAALAGATADQVGRILELLTQACLIRHTESARYGMHDLLRGYARELAGAREGEQEQRAALTRLFDYYLHAAVTATDTVFPAERYRRPPLLTPPPAAAPALAREADALAWLDAERPSLVVATGHAAEHGWPGHATLLSATLYRYLDIGGHYLEAIGIHSSALRAARGAGDRSAEAGALTRLGAVGLRQRRYPEAADCYQQSLAVSREISDPAGQAEALATLGFLEFLQGYPQPAVAHLRQALALDRELGDRKAEAHALASLGFVELRQGRYRQAAEYLQLSHGLFRDVRDRVGQAHALGNLGDVELRQGHYRDAARHLREALDLCRAIGDRSNAADVLAMLGVTELRQGHHQEAVGYLREALDLCRQTGDLSTQATVLNGLGEVSLAAARTTDAGRQHAAALSAATEVGEKYEQARAHEGLANACQFDGDTRKASRHWHVALSLYTELGAPEAEQVRAKLGVEAEAELTRGLPVPVLPGSRVQAFANAASVSAASGINVLNVTGVTGRGYVYQTGGS
jgi:tetratricopeptide (TPR) repeat protein/DNA-binding XRE family transcriptional regulator